MYLSTAICILGLSIGLLASSCLADATDNETAEEPLYRFLRSTLIGSSGYDDIRCVEFSTEGDLFLLGYSSDPAYLDPTIGFDRDFYTAQDPFIMKVSRDLTHIIWSTVLKGSFYDVPFDMALGPDGDVYIVGTTTSLDLTVSNVAYQRLHQGGVTDAFVCRLSGTNGSIIYSTYLGGDNYDYGTGIAVDDDGRAVVVGTTRSQDFPRTYHGTYSDNNRRTTWTYLVRLSDGGHLEYSSWLGADCYIDIDFEGSSALIQVVLDSEGHPIVAGTTHSNNLTTYEGSYQRSNAGIGDLFVCKLTPEAKGLVFATYIGGSDTEYLRGLALDEDDNIVLTGWTISRDFPTTFGSYCQTLGGLSDGFVLKLTSDGGWLVWSSLMSIGDDYINRDVEIGPDGDVYVTGTNITWRYGQTGHAYSEYEPIFVKMDPKGTRREYTITDFWRTQANAIIVDRTGTVVAVGSTRSDDFLITPGTIRTKGARYHDGYILVWSEDVIAPVADAGDGHYLPGPGMIQLDGTASRDDLWIANWTWTVGLGDHLLNLSGPTPWVTLEAPGDYPVVLTVTDGGFNEDQDMTWILVRDPVRPVAVAGTDFTVDSGTPVTFDGSGSHDNLGLGEFVWSFTYDNRLVQISGRTIHTVFDLPGVYDILLTVWDLDGNSAADDLRLEVLDTNAPLVVTRVPNIVDQYTVVVLDGSQSHDDVGIVRAEWRIIEGGAYHDFAGLVTTHRFVEAGAHSIALHMWDAAGNHAAESSIINVNDTTPPRVNAGPDVFVGVDRPVFFDGSATSDNTGIHLFEWSFSYEGGTMVFNGSGPHSFRFALPSVHFIVLKAIDSFGNVGTDYFRVGVVDNIPPSADAGRDIQVFVGEGVDLLGSLSRDNIGITEYRWYIGQDEHSVMLRGVFQDLVMDRPGEYYILLVVRDAAGNTDWDWKRVIVSAHEEGDTTSQSYAMPGLVSFLIICFVLSVGIAYIKRTERKTM